MELGITPIVISVMIMLLACANLIYVDLPLKEDRAFKLFSGAQKREFFVSSFFIIRVISY